MEVFFTHPLCDTKTQRRRGGGHLRRYFYTSVGPSFSLLICWLSIYLSIGLLSNYPCFIYNLPVGSITAKSTVFPGGVNAVAVLRDEVGMKRSTGQTIFYNYTQFTKTRNSISYFKLEIHNYIRQQFCSSNS